MYAWYAFWGDSYHDSTHTCWAFPAHGAWASVGNIIDGESSAYKDEERQYTSRSSRFQSTVCIAQNVVMAVGRVGN